MPALEAEYLSRIVAGKTLVNNISVQVQVGEVLAIVGPSGSGKTSFLRLLNRLDEPTSGIIRFNGQDYRALRRGSCGNVSAWSCRRRIFFPAPWPTTSRTGRFNAGKRFRPSRLPLSFSASTSLDIRNEA